MTNLQTIGQQVTMSSLELVQFASSLSDFNAALGELSKQETKDRVWFDQAMDLVESAGCLDELYFIKRAMFMHICGCYGSALLDSSNANSESTLYVMESKAMNAVKVGRTSCGVEKRSSQLKVGCPDVGVVYQFPGKGSLEKSVHQELKPFRLGGEWFSVSPEFAEKVVRKAASDVAPA